MQLYVGGRFDTAGGEPWNVNNVVRTGLTGSQWFPMGTTPAGGLNGPALALARDPNSTDGVYAGGTFTRAGSASANRVARWSESGGWTALGAGVDGPVYALAADGNDLYVGGSFTTAGGAGARNIARWNAITQSWHPLGAGPANGVAQGSVYAIVAAGEDVFVGGDFSVVDGIGGGTLALYHRTTNDWSRPAFSVLLGSYGGVVRALARDGDSLYIGGWFDQACGTNGCIPAAGVAACSISTGVCAALGSGIPGSDVVNALTVGPTGLLFVGGSFTAAGGINANGIARWDPATARLVGPGTRHQRHQPGRRNRRRPGPVCL